MISDLQDGNRVKHNENHLVDTAMIPPQELQGQTPSTQLPPIQVSQR